MDLYFPSSSKLRQHPQRPNPILVFVIIVPTTSAASMCMVSFRGGREVIRFPVVSLEGDVKFCIDDLVGREEVGERFAVVRGGDD